MTTVVYDHKNGKIACDGKILNGYQIRGLDFVKWREKDGDVFFFAGSVADIQPFMDCGKNLFDKPENKIDISCLMVRDGLVYECGYDEHEGFWMVPSTYDNALGSGLEWALAALDFGCDVVQAIRYAETKDSGTGGRITVFDVKSMSFEDEQ